MNRLVFALRNLARHRRRSLLTGGIVAFGFAACALAGGFMAQSFEGLRASSIRSGLGHLQFADARAFAESEERTLAFGLENAERLGAILAADPAVEVAMPRIEFLGLATAGRRSLPFLGLGVAPAAEARGSDIPATVTAGRWLTEERAVVLGAGLAKALGARVGGTVTLLATTPDGTLNAVDAEIAGIADIRLKELNDRYLATTLTLARELLAAPDTVSKISVLLREPADEQAAAERLRVALAGEAPRLAVKRWEELAPFYGQVRLLYLGIFGFMGAVLLVVVFLATVNATLMSVTERTREIGTLRALGARRHVVVADFAVEALALALLACAAGAALALVVSTALNASGIVLPPPPGATRGFPIHVQFFPAAYLAAALVMTAAVVSAAYFPARRAARAPIVEALAHV
jgi:putative ABC transport system permease protein